MSLTQLKTYRVGCDLEMSEFCQAVGGQHDPVILQAESKTDAARELGKMGWQTQYNGVCWGLWCPSCVEYLNRDRFGRVAAKEE